MFDVVDINTVINDPERVKKVVCAAAVALNTLEGPNPTADGDDAMMVARNQLQTGFMDEEQLAKDLKKIGL